ncbi:hypothetical protein, partial [Microvirga vignae]|uniref:hypothetical protein n=1 Tax=Microvirga vignae TaxID=1225564 RepID=UPI00063FF25F
VALRPSPGEDHSEVAIPTLCSIATFKGEMKELNSLRVEFQGSERLTSQNRLPSSGSWNSEKPGWLSASGYLLATWEETVQRADAGSPLKVLVSALGLEPRTL